MREKRFYMLSGNNDDIKSIMSKIRPYEAENGLKSVDGIYTDTEEHEFLLRECKNRGIKLIFARFEMEYSKSELENAKYFRLSINSYCSEFSEEYGTEYNYDKKCKCCGAGREQVSDLYVDKNKMGNKDISYTYDFQTVISEKLYSLFIDNDITGVKFGKVHHKKKGKIKNDIVLYQLKSTTTLPPLNENSVLFKEQFCECCKRSGLFLQSLPYYGMESLREAKDFNYTSEYFGGGLAGKPLFIVSQKVYKLFKDNKIKGVSFDIVNIV